MSLKIETATRTDDRELRGLLKEMPMPGFVKVAYLREPSFFDAVKVEGHTTQVVIARDGDTIAGFGTRSVKPCYVNGKPTRIGYLSSLRLRERYRNGFGLARGYNYLRQLHQQDGKTLAYLSTVLETNDDAKRIITSRRAGLPAYHDNGLFKCAAIRTRGASSVRTRTGIRVAGATPADFEEVLDFWHREGPKRQFFPVYEPNDFKDALLMGLRIENILLARIDKNIVGTVSLWDQSSFKGSLVSGFDPWFQLLRPAYNGAAKIFGYPSIPPVGRTLNLAYLSTVCVKENDPSVFQELFSAARVANRNRDFVLVGYHEHDPLSPVFRAYRRFNYPSRFYIVTFDEESDFVQSLDGRPIYLELGGL